MIKRFRQIFRILFCRTPIWLDGPFISARMRDGKSWDEALEERSRMNCLALLRWYEGEKNWDRDLSMRYIAAIGADGVVRASAAWHAGAKFGAGPGTA